MFGWRPGKAVALALTTAGCAISHPPLAELPPAPRPPADLAESLKSQLASSRKAANEAADAVGAAEEQRFHAAAEEARARESLAEARNRLAAAQAPGGTDTAQEARIGEAKAEVLAAERRLDGAAKRHADWQAEERRVRLEQDRRQAQTIRLAALCVEIRCEDPAAEANGNYRAFAEDSVQLLATVHEAGRMGNLYRERYLKSAKLRTALDLPVLGLGTFAAWRTLDSLAAGGTGSGSGNGSATAATDKANAALEDIARVGVGVGAYTLARDRLLPAGLPATYRNGYSGMACIIFVSTGFLSLNAFQRQWLFDGAMARTRSALDAVVQQRAMVQTAAPDLGKEQQATASAMLKLADARTEQATQTLTEAARQQRAWERRTEAFGEALHATSETVSKGALVPSGFDYESIRKALAPQAAPSAPATGRTESMTRAQAASAIDRLDAAIVELANARSTLEAAMPDHLAALERLKSCPARAAGQPS